MQFFASDTNDLTWWRHLINACVRQDYDT